MIYKLSTNFFLINKEDTNAILQKDPHRIWLGLAFAFLQQTPSKGLKIFGQPHHVIQKAKNFLIEGAWNPFQDQSVLINSEHQISNWMLFSILVEQEPFSDLTKAIRTSEDQIRNLRPTDLWISIPLQDIENSLIQKAGTTSQIIWDQNFPKWFCLFRNELPSYIRLWCHLNTKEDLIVNQFYRDLLSEKWQQEKAIRYGSPEKLDQTNLQARPSHDE